MIASDRQMAIIHGDTPAEWSEIERPVFRKLSMDRHPDRQGGSTDKMAELNRAYEQAQKELGT